jgi:hypothetical protein
MPIEPTRNVNAQIKCPPFQRKASRDLVTHRLPRLLLKGIVSDIPLVAG